ncbi:MAG: hypothetical protein CL424_16830 [Acidimicrobiaceae bacterium]|nr:hypothetical protein [Acidimicrobiaceae bacterium]
MTTSLEHDIRTALARQADRTTIDAAPEFGERPLRLHLDSTTRPRHRRLVPLMAAAAVLVAVAGLVVVTQLRDETPAPLAERPAVDASSAAVGLYPAGEVDSIVAAGFDTPQAAVDAYLADRTRPDVVPDGYTVTYSVSDLEPPRIRDDAAVVGFSLATENDTGDGLLLVRQVGADAQPERWVVTGGGIGTFTIDQLDFRDGQLTGSFTNDAGGQTQVDVYDAASGERLAQSSDDPFTIDDLTASAVTVRFWNTVADGGYPIAVFAEAIVHSGETVTDIGESALHDQYYDAIQQQVEGTHEPFDTGPIAAFLPEVAGDMVTIVDEPGFKIDAQVQPVQRTGQDEYCLAITWAGQELPFDTQATCFSAEAIAMQQDIGNGAGLGGPVAVLDSLDGTQVLVVGAVPDAVTDIRTETGKNITPTHNIWWDVIDSGSLVTYKIIASDGRTTELTAG